MSDQVPIPSDTEVRLSTLADNAKLIQRLVNALDETKDAFELYASCQCDGTGCPICRTLDRAENALFSANDQGFKPTNR